MTIPRTKAIRLLSAGEQRYYEASRRGQIDDHGATQLKRFIAQTRKLVDKYRERQKAQARRAVGKDKRPSPAHASREGAENTRLKADIFSDILERFEAALRRAEARAQPDRPRPRPREKKQNAKEARAKTRSTDGIPKSKKKTIRKAAPSSKTKTQAKTPQRGPLSSPSLSKKKAVRRASARQTKEAAEVSILAHAARAPIAAEQPRKGHIAAVRAQVAHASSRGRRHQAKRDNR